MKIRQHLVPTAIARKITNGTGNAKRKICIHETDNTNRGARADNHARLQANGNSRKASWHWQVDDKEAIQSFAHDWRCWAAGSTKGNNEAIHIEICVNSDGDYIRSVENAAKLTAKILKEEKLTVNDVVQHNYYSGKNCPRIMRSGAKIKWQQFLKMVKSEMKGGIDMKEVKHLQSQINELRDTLNSVVNTIPKKADKINHTEVDAWAKDAVDWAYKEGIIVGNGAGLNLSGALTRQELLVMLYRYHNKYVK